MSEPREPDQARTEEPRRSLGESPDVPWGGSYRQSSERAGGLRVQSGMWVGIAVFMLVTGQIYGFITFEQAGTVMLTLSGVLALSIAVYLGFPRKVERQAEGRPGADQPAEPWFPHDSIWPFAMGVGVLAIANGLLLGLWLLLPAVVFMIFAVAGFVVQSRYRL